MTVKIELIGEKELAKKLHRLADKTQKKIVKRALREASKRARDRIVNNIRAAGLIASGALIEAFEGSKIRSASRNPRKLIRMGVVSPTREELGIDSSDQYYYPFAVEFGHNNVPAIPFIRPAMDEHSQAEFSKIGNDIGKGIRNESKR